MFSKSNRFPQSTEKLSSLASDFKPNSSQREREREERDREERGGGGGGGGREMH